MTDHNAVDRQKKIVQILSMLHEGESFEDAKAIFDATFDGVDVAEITSAERELIASGLNPMEIQTLCNVHAAVFRGKINNGEKTPMEAIPGHPVQVMKLENVVLMSLLNDELLPALKKWQQSGTDAVQHGRMTAALADLATIDKHYLRKENLIFPLMDKYGITAPPKVMWGVDDDIRGWIRAARRLLAQEPAADKYDVEAAVEKVAKEVDEMVFKEEEIMLPMVLEVFSAADWALIQRESPAIGFTLIPTPLPWRPTAAELATKPQPAKMAAALNEMAKALAASQDLGSTRQQAPSDAALLAQIHRDSPAPAEVQAKLAAAAQSAATTVSTAAATAAPDDVAAAGPRITVAPRKGPAADTAVAPAATGAGADLAASAATAASGADAAPAGMPAAVAAALGAGGSPAPGATSGGPDGRIEIDGVHPARVLLPTGSFDLAQLTHVLRLLPLDLTFVDDTDTVRWFSDSGERVFPRTTAVIGRKVQNCHPPRSVDKVEKILTDFHAGRERHADFWINLHGERMVYIRYFAITDQANRYLGCLEVTQDITAIQRLTGEKRLGD
ncbi:DUF438 domain-containing protein [Lacticaseibacillus parakribbianus]|uniref:DUF438 domain-containing protein n=1 Tax=Lacticaseibacillus parakribbianus TaxID=2970927 RepID=UPI0021CB643B|nr:DUF438 domain-containing protein [Lacticaseibacillus parakribbianus]